jgi:hypothetical protein
MRWRGCLARCAASLTPPQQTFWPCRKVVRSMSLPAWASEGMGAATGSTPTATPEVQAVNFSLHCDPELRRHVRPRNQAVVPYKGSRPMSPRDVKRFVPEP